MRSSSAQGGVRFEEVPILSPVKFGGGWPSSLSLTGYSASRLEACQRQGARAQLAADPIIFGFRFGQLDLGVWANSTIGDMSGPIVDCFVGRDGCSRPPLYGRNCTVEPFH